jgi:ADP-ribose pyrophosphatase
MAADSLRKIGEFYMVPGYSTECMHLFLAGDLTPDPLEADQDEFISLEVISMEKAYAMLNKGELHDAKTIIGLLLARPFLSDV